VNCALRKSRYIVYCDMYGSSDETWICLAGTLQLSSNKLDALVLYVCIRLVRQVSGSNTEAMSCVADAVTLYRCQLGVHYLAEVIVTYIGADIQCLTDPVGRNATDENSEAVDVLGGRPAVGVDVASQARLVMRVSDEENTLNRVERGTSKLGHSVNGGCSTLRISLKDVASLRVGLQSGIDLVDDLWLSVQLQDQCPSDPRLTSVVPEAEF
jgi:hypothetical protein